VAAKFDVGLVCSRADGVPPRTRLSRVAYPDVVADVLETTLGLAAQAVRAGVDPDRIGIDPAHDFGKNTWHSLEISRRLDELTATGWPVLMAASRKDFVGETIGAADVEDRLMGIITVTALGAWLGARIFRAYDVQQTKQALQMVAEIKGDAVPARVVRDLA
jgi:dihydropteroate synthase